MTSFPVPLSYVRIGIALLLLALALFWFNETYCSIDPHLTTRVASALSPGYVLVAPFIADNDYAGPGEVELLDSRGVAVHTWHTEYPVYNAILEPSGTLAVSLIRPLIIADYPGGGTNGILEELDWNGKVLFEYADPRMTHDFDVLPDDSFVYTRWDPTPASFAARVVGGIHDATTTVWADELVRINTQKQVLWTWRVSDHLNPADYPVNSSIPRSDWAHLNSVRYVADNPISHVPAFLISLRDISTLFLIDAKNGNVIWHSPAGIFSLQHDATLLANGDILAFDNGLDRPGLPLLESRVVELNPLTNSVVSTYQGGETLGDQILFNSDIMGGAQRLANGNTLITLSAASRILETTPSGKVVWDYANDFRTASGTAQVLFKARKYDPAGTVWGAWLDGADRLSEFCTSNTQR